MAEGFFWMPYGRNLRKSISKSLEKHFLIDFESIFDRFLATQSPS
jgi:hypothetical protein